ncbi:hypothetical protein FHR32_008330 [Streptosporangium album]|uniref:Uncharacterized protein n=1 Tax=Streptosporangium album TaxID=47479 RepID=A0A7W7S4X0_9ACTN|nr:hypothetical protein [Streptosporangium album]MBB4943929.1 hypothetical protein [Streptosporangium album]
MQQCTGATRREHPLYRALAEHDKRQRHPDTIEQAHTTFAADQANT